MRCKHELDLYRQGDCLACDFESGEISQAYDDHTCEIVGCASCHPTRAAVKVLADFEAAPDWVMPGRQGFSGYVDPASGSMTPMKAPKIDSVPPAPVAEWIMPTVPLEGKVVKLASYGRPSFASEYWHGTVYSDTAVNGEDVVLLPGHYWDDAEVIDPGESVVN